MENDENDKTEQFKSYFDNLDNNSQKQDVNEYKSIEDNIDPSIFNYDDNKQDSEPQKKTETDRNYEVINGDDKTAQSGVGTDLKLQNNGSDGAEKKEPEEEDADEDSEKKTYSNKDNLQTYKSFDDVKNMHGGEQKVTHNKAKFDRKKIKLIILCVVGFMGLCFMLAPEITKLFQKKTDERNVNVKGTNHFTDIESIGNDFKEENPYQEPKKEEGLKDPEIFDEIGVNSKYTENNTNLPTISYVPSGGGGSSSYISDRPDTRNDRIQGKSISGIKGLTSTQQNYATDYQQTIEKNAKEAASKSRAAANYTNPMSKEAYTSMLQQGNNSYASQNNQSQKNSFYNSDRNAGGDGNYLGLNTIWTGTIFEITLTSDINTDLPGEVTARVAKNVYSSQDGRYLLIPQNSIIYGSYSSDISYSQSRVQIGWHTLIRPDGYKVSLGNMNGTDAKGASGVHGFVNDHPLAYVKALGVMSIFTILNSQFQKAVDSTNNEYVQNVTANAQQLLNQIGDKLIERAQDIQPTIHIKAGKKLNVVVNQELTLPPAERIPVMQKYMKGTLPREIR